jgi:hypothetical protein
MEYVYDQKGQHGHGTTEAPIVSTSKPIRSSAFGTAPRPGQKTYDTGYGTT